MIELFTIVGDGQDPESLRNKLIMALFILDCLIAYIIYDLLTIFFVKKVKKRR